VVETPNRVENVVCVASFFKGADFLRECRERGARVFLVTRERTLNEEWPRDCIDDFVAIPNDASLDLFLYAVSHLARRVRIDRVVALEEFDVVNTALLREQLQVPGMHGTAARAFRDKLTMRVRARRAGIRVPDFVHVLNHDALHSFMARVSAPWVLKPRSDVSSIGIRKLHGPEQLWRAVEELDGRGALHERSPYYVLEQYVAGEVFHVDSLVEGGEVTFAGVNRYGRPPLDVAQQGGVYVSRTLDYESEDRARLEEFNRRLLTSLGLESGAAHAEFIKGEADGEFYFLEVASRVGGAYMAETLEAGSGVNLWREWARLELAGGVRPAGERPRPRREYGGIALSLARQEWPDTAAYDDPEIAYRVRKPWHVGLVVGSPSLARVEELLDDYARRFAADFCAVAPPHERPPL
jgi:biotin carboxylase